MHHAVHEDRHVLEVGPEVEFGPPPICLIVVVQQHSSSSPLSRLRRWFAGVMRICRASFVFSSLIGSDLVKDGSHTQLDGTLGVPGMLCYC